MNRSHRRIIGLGILIALLVSTVGGAGALMPLAAPTSASAAPATPQDTPIQLVDEPYARWTLGGGFLYWGQCSYTPSRVDSGRGAQAVAATGYLRRMPAFGGTTRTLSSTAFCDTLLAADDSGLYSWDGTSIQKRPSSAPTTPAAIYTPSSYISRYNQPPVTPLVLDDTSIYWASASKIMRLTKDGGNITIIADAGSNPTSLAISADMISWLADNGLWQVNKACPYQPCGETQISAAHGADLLYYPHRRFSLSYQSSFYWANGSLLQAYTCRVDVFPMTCFIETLYQGAASSHIGRIGTDGDSLFWPETFCIYIDGICHDTQRILRQPFTSSTPAVLAEGIAGYHTQLWTDELGVYFENPAISRLPFSASAITHDLRPVAWEVTQGVQSLNNDVPLVAGKPTAVRVYGRQLDGPLAANVEAVLAGARNGTPLPGSPLQAVNGPHALSTGGTFDRARLSDSWLFVLPASWTASGPVNLSALVDSRNLYSKPSPASNQLAGTFTFTQKPPVCIVAIPVRTNGPAANPTSANMRVAANTLKQLWPVPAVWLYHQDNDIAKLQPRFGLPPWEYVPYQIPENTTRMLISLTERDMFSDDPDACDNAGATTHYIGIVSPSTPTGNADPNVGTNGSGRVGYNQAWVKLPPDEVTLNDWQGIRAGTLAHEMAHNNNRQHVNCGGPDDPDANYPYDPCTLDDGRFGVNATHYGFNLTTFTPLEPATTQDLMTYTCAGTPTLKPGCRPRWMSDYTWKGLFGSLALASADGAVIDAAAPDLAAAAAAVHVVGTLAPSNSQGTLSYAWTLPAAALGPGLLRKWQAVAAPSYRPGGSAGDLAAAGYHLRVLAADGTTLDDRIITPVYNDLHDQDSLVGAALDNQMATFNLTFPAPAGLVARLDLMSGDALLASLQPGPHKPAIQVLAPAAGASIADQMTVTWQAADADAGDSLVFTVQYSPDGGQSWRALATNIANPAATGTLSLPLDQLSGIPGSLGAAALIRVMASDGYNTGLATSQPFTLANRQPDVAIDTPVAGQVLAAGQPLLLSGTATDPEDGELSGASLDWSVDGQPVGAEQPLVGLAPGQLVVALTARDADGQQQTAYASISSAALIIPAGTAPALDGTCDDGAYLGAASVRLAAYSTGDQATAHMLRTPTDLWVCFSGLQRTGGGPGDNVGIRIDRDNSRDPSVQPDDAAFFVGEDGTPNQGPATLQTRTSATDGAWNAELRIPAAGVGGFNHIVGIDLAQHWVQYVGDDHHWPFSALYDQPHTWAQAVLGEPPLVSGLSPVQATVHSANLTLTITGTNFMAGAQVQWNGTPRPTTFVDPTHLRAQVGASDLAAPGTAAIRVINPDLADAPSNALAFTVRNPTPTLATLTPRSILAGGPQLTLTLTGSGFEPGATLLWNGEAVPVTIMSSSELRATIPPSRLAVGGSATLAVANPAPGGAASNPLVLSITSAGSVRVYLPLVRR
jgi:hypothetical protein